VCTILIRASNQLIAEDIKRSLYDAICSVRDSITTRKAVVGGGAMECEMYVRLKKWLKNYVQRECSWIQKQRGSISNVEQERLYQHVDVIEAFASSLLCIPLILAENAGVPNNTAMVQDLISLHMQDTNHCYHGFYMSNNNDSHLKLSSLIIEDMRQTQTFENLKMKECVWKLATEMACTILKIDHVIVFQ
jgi:chaperonin GroEL (HSP60 family)